MKTSTIEKPINDMFHGSEKKAEMLSLLKKITPQNEKWTNTLTAEQNDDMPRLRVISSCSQTTSSTSFSIYSHRYQNHSTNIMNSEKNQKETPCNFEDQSNKSISPKSDKNVQSNHHDVISYSIHEEELHKTKPYENDKFNQFSLCQVQSKIENNIDVDVRVNLHEPPPVLLSPPTSFWNRITFYFCKQNLSLNTCCIYSKVKSTEKKEYTKDILPQTPNRSKLKFVEDSVSASCPMHLLQTAKRSNTKKKKEKKRDAFSESLADDTSTYVTKSSTRNTLSSLSPKEANDVYFEWNLGKIQYNGKSPQKAEENRSDNGTLYYSANAGIENKDDVSHQHQCVPIKVVTTSKKKKKERQYFIDCKTSPIFYADNYSMKTSGRRDQNVVWSPQENRVTYDFLGSDLDGDDANSLSPLTITSTYKNTIRKISRQRLNSFQTTHTCHTRNLEWYEFDEQSLDQIFSVTNESNDNSKKPQKLPRFAIPKLLATEQQNDLCHDIISPCSTLTSGASPYNQQFYVGSSINKTKQKNQFENYSKFSVLQNIETNDKDNQTNTEMTKYPVQNTFVGKGVGNCQNYARYEEDEKEFSTPFPPSRLLTKMSKLTIAVEGWVVCIESDRLPRDEEMFTSQDLCYMWCCKSALTSRGELHFWKPKSLGENFESLKLQLDRQSTFGSESFKSVVYEDVKIRWISPTCGHGISVTSKDDNSHDKKELILFPINMGDYVVANNIKDLAESSLNDQNISRRDHFVHQSKDLIKYTNVETARLSKVEWLCNTKLFSSSRQTDTTLHFLFCMDFAQKKK